MGKNNVCGAGWCKLEYTSIPDQVKEYLSSPVF
jgi:hypothetical protein